MAGHIRPRGETWEVRLSDGRQPDGRRRMRTRTVPTLELAEQLLSDWLDIGGDPLELGEMDDRRCTRRRFPLEPLVALVRPMLRAAHRDPAQVDGFSRVKMAKLVGVDRRQIYRWDESGLNADHADRAATRIGLHPALIWGPDWWD